MPIITFENKWALNFSPLTESTYKMNYHDTISYGDQIKNCLESLDDKEDQHAILSAKIICQAFGYQSIDDITDILVLKVLMNTSNNLCLKIAVPHPLSTNECYVGTFVLNAAMNIINLDHVETLKRKVPPLPLFKVPEKAWYEFNFKENTDPNKLAHSATASTPKKKTGLCDSYRTLPISDEMLAKIMADNLSINDNNSGFKP